MIVSHNLTAMNASRQFNINRKDKSKITEKLSSGYKINRAADDAAGLAISEKMRRQIRGLNRAADNIQDGISLCNVADGALNEIHDIMQRERQLLIQAGNDTNSDTDKEYLQQEINQLSGEFDRIFDSTTFNEIKLFKGVPAILRGPETRVDGGIVKDETNSSDVKKSILWVGKGEAAPSGGTTTNTTNDVKIVTERHIYENEISSDKYPDIEPNHPKFCITDETVSTETDTRVDTTITDTYKKITDPAELALYTELKDPANTIGANGYVNRLTNMAGNVNLSCAMSQLGVKVDGQLINVSLYNGNYAENTTYSDDGKKAVTSYKLQDGLYLQQTITMSDSKDAYMFDFEIKNETGASHTIDLRFAFDVMNETTPNVNDGTSKEFTINGSIASVKISGSSGSGGSLDKAVLGSIDKMYGSENWDAGSIEDGKTETVHMGAGFWWSASSADSSDIEIGKVKYGPIQYNSEPYELTRKTDVLTTVSTLTSSKYEETDILPRYLDIQAGTEKDMIIPIRLWDLSCETMGVRAGSEVTVNSVGTSLDNIDRAFEKVNHIRSYYGAMTNRLEHAYRVNKNSEENTQAAESVIRDTDMAKTMVEYSNHNILEQAGTSMLAQAKQSNQDVLALLS